MPTAQVDTASGFVFATTSSQLDAKNAPAGVTFVALSDDAPSPLGLVWDGSKFSRPVPKPNTPNNPYFGKKALDTKDFYALVGKVLSPDRLKRLLSDSHFLWVGKVLDHVNTVDPDDKAGQFLQIIGYLVGTKGDDGELLMTETERDTVMAAWP